MPVLRLAALLLALECAAAYVLPTPVPRARYAAARASSVVMDETIIQKALDGELEEEGAENIFLSELGWAMYLDKEAKSSYNMNQRPSMADDDYFTPDAFANPLDVLLAWKDSVLSAAGRPLETAFPTITNDNTGARNYPPGTGEVKARTIQPKKKDFDAKKRITGIPGFNFFGSPSSKQDL